MVGEVRRILGVAAETFAELSDDTEANERSLRDSNGNSVGTIDVDPECDEDEDEDDDEYEEDDDDGRW
jgi:hypothetical protein